MALAIVAQADTLAYSEIYDFERVLGTSYEVNAAQTSAWLNIQLYRSMTHGEDPADYEVKRDIDGLTYDKATREFIYQDAATPAVPCAYLVSHHVVVGWTTVKATGLCGITRTEVLTEVVGHGSTAYTIRVLQAYFGKLPPARRGDLAGHIPN